jgi:delta24-sterol reductase
MNKDCCMQRGFVRFLTQHRGWIIFLIAVPISFLIECTQRVRNFIFRVLVTSPHYHNKAVEQIQRCVRKAYLNKQKMCTARRPWKTMSLRVATYKNSCAQIPIDLKNILSIDTVNQIIRVEPMVTMSDITHFLVPKGYALAVHPEMDDLTIGGLCMGAGIETSSHRHGFLFETIEALEVIIADGSLIRATKTQHADLFHALPWSHGTLGFLVAVELKIIPVKPYMQMEYIPCHTQEEFCKQFQSLAESTTPPAYLEALVFSPSSTVIMCGELVDVSELQTTMTINPINRWYKKWFFSHVETFLTKGRHIELIPLKHYFHRHTPSVFFQLKELIPFANNRWYRYLFAWLGAPKISLMKLTYTKSLRKQAMYKRITQDIIVPITALSESLDFNHHHFGIYPLWICPVKLFEHTTFPGFLRNPEGCSAQLYVDVGIYGIPKAVSENKPWDMIAISRQLEAFTMAKKGYHLLYADIFMTRSEFEHMFDHHHYRAMRKQYLAEQAFPEVYDKIIPESWLFNGEDHHSTTSS